MVNTTLEGVGDLLEGSREAEKTGVATSGEPAIQTQVEQTGTIATTLLGESAEEERERQLNAGCDRQTILENKACELVELSDREVYAFQTLRRGYPDKPFTEQCQGREFRAAADQVISAIAEHTLQGLNPDKAVVLMPWRAGLAFGKAYMERGVHKFYHVSSRRDEKTLKTIVDYESGLIEPGDTVIMADPMLATGNTARDAIDRMLASGLSPEQIIVNAVIAAPVGVQAVKQYPAIRVVVGALDEKLDHRGYIILGCGDFGDKYFGDFTESDVAATAATLKIDGVSHRKLAERFRAQAEA